MAMSDEERLFWLQKCVDHNESLEEQHGSGPSKTVDKGFSI